MMNMKHLLMLLALGGLGASCSNDDLVDGNNVVTNGRTEIQIAFSGTGENQEYTRAIATPSENEIKTLKIYLFAAAAEAGPYYFLEEWTEGIAYVPGNPNGTNFVKQESGGGYKATLYPNELKGLPWVKLMCVANNGITADGTPGGTTDGEFYAEDGTTKQPALVKVTTDPATGAVNNAPTTEATFRTAYTAALGTDVPTGVIATPLLMTGVGVTKISGSVSKVSIDLKRIVARFDIENKTSSSSLTITSVHMAQGRINGSLWGVTPVENAALLTAYQPRTFTATDGINLGLGENAIYTYPGAVADESYLVIVGTYKSPVTSEQVPVTYNIPVVRTPEGAQPGTPGTYLQLKPNSRYKLRITDVSQSNVFGTFEVVDWTSGGGINVRPENSAPVFVGDEAFTGANLPTNLNPDPNHAPPYNYEVNGDAGTFSIEIGATGKVRAEKTEVATRALANDWMTIGNPTTEERDGVWYSTFNITYANAVGQQPIAVRFINETASFDPSLWTVVNFYGPKAKPALTEGGAGTLGNTVDYITTPLAPTAKMYNIVGSFIKVKAMCIEGTTLVLPDEFEQTGEPIVEGNFSTFTIKIKTKLTDGSTYELKFQNAKGKENNPPVETVMEVTPIASQITDPMLGDDAGTGVNALATITGTTVKSDIDLLGTANTYTLNIHAPQGVAVTIPTDKWLTITEGALVNGVTPYTVALNSAVTTYTNFDLVFENKLDATDKLTVTMSKAMSKPKMETTTGQSIFNEAPVFDDVYAGTVKMYAAEGSLVKVKMTCADAAKFADVSGLTITPTDKPADDIYTITVAAGHAFTGGSTAVIEAQNSADASRKATLTITWLDAAITVKLAEENAGAALNGDNINVTYATLGDYAPIVIKVTGYKGSTITYGGTANDWLARTAVPAKIDDSGIATITFMKGGATTPADTGDITITVTNAIPGGGDKTITLKKL